MHGICEIPLVIDEQKLSRLPTDDLRKNGQSLQLKRRSLQQAKKYLPPDVAVSGAVVVDFRPTSDAQISRRITEGVTLLRQWGNEILAARSSSETSVIALAG